MTLLQETKGGRSSKKTRNGPSQSYGGGTAAVPVIADEQPEPQKNHEPLKDPPTDQPHHQYRKTPKFYDQTQPRQSDPKRPPTSSPPDPRPLLLELGARGNFTPLDNPP